MKSIICSRYGPPEVLQIKDRPNPKPKPDEILIKTHFSTVTAGDSRMRAFRVPRAFWLPARLALGIFKPRKEIPGMEISGVVVEVGAQVTKFNVGDRVMASTTEFDFGAYAEFLAYPENGVIAKFSKSLSFEDAATLPVGARTALHFLREANIQPGYRVLINGASGSVGTLAIQIAKSFQADVTAVCSGKNEEMVKLLGADKVINYEKEDFFNNGELYDVIFDTVGKIPLKRGLRSLKEGGVYLHAVGDPSILLKMAILSRRTGKKMIAGGASKNSEDLYYLAEQCAKGIIKPYIHKQFIPEDIIEAHRLVDSGRKRGNVVVNWQG